MIIIIIIIIINILTEESSPHPGIANIAWTQCGNRIKTNENDPVNFIVRTYNYKKQY